MGRKADQDDGLTADRLKTLVEIETIAGNLRRTTRADVESIPRIMEACYTLLGDQKYVFVLGENTMHMLRDTLTRGGVQHVDEMDPSSVFWVANGFMMASTGDWLDMIHKRSVYRNLKTYASLLPPGSMPGNIGQVTHEQNTHYFKCVGCYGVFGIDVVENGEDQDSERTLNWPTSCPLCGSEFINEVEKP